MKTPSQIVPALPLVALLSVAIGAGACSESSDGGDGDSGDGDSTFLFCSPADTCPPNVDGVDLATPVSFRTDIYEGYFRDGCGGSGCHSTQSTAAAGLYFGDADDPLEDAEISALIAQLKGAPSEIAPGELNVVPGDWQSSWLMAKLDGCQSDYGIACNADSEYLILSVCDDPCGDGMPASEGSAESAAFATTEAERAKVHMVRAWIAQGAEDN